MRPVAHFCALVLGAGAAIMVGCGGDRAGLLPVTAADSVKGELQAVENAVADGDCGASAAAIDKARSAVRNAADLDPKLRSNLLNGLGRLSGRASTECTPTAATQETTTTEVPTTETTAPETTSTADTDPTTPAQTDDTTPTVPTDPGTTPPDPNSGGASPEDPSTTDPGTGVPDPGGAAPTDPSGGDDQGFRGTGRDRGTAQGYLP